MSRLRLPDHDATIELQKGQSVGAALRDAGLGFEMPCNGEGLCGQCAVWVDSGLPPTPHENITQAEEAQGLRLACQLMPETDLTVRLAHHQRETSILPQPEDGPPPTGAVPAAAVDQIDGRFWLRYDGGEPIALDVWEASWSPKGLAIDIGTTTLALTLVCLRTGRELATTCALNPQSMFGHDVMTRIGMGSSPEGLEELTAAVRYGLTELLEEVNTNGRSDSWEVVDVVIGGNTTMLQLAAGIDPTPLGRSPFTVDIRGGESYPGGRFGLPVNPAARVYIPPVAHAFFGSDVSAGLARCDGFFSGSGTTLFVDLGTNGELALAAGERRLFASTAAGPAFEGMGLSSGLRACSGAVEAVRFTDHRLVLRTIGGLPIAGVCGSGVIDLVACLLETGAMSHTGRLQLPDKSGKIPRPVADRLEQRDGQRAFRLGQGIYFTQKDVRQVQLAKGAVRAAIDIFLQEADMVPDAVDELVVAGAFGRSVRPESLEAIGMIPPGMGATVSFAGNTSLRGCVRLLQDGARRRFIEREMGRMEQVSLAEHSEFSRVFVSRMHFPLRDRVEADGQVGRM